jgi:hypothetical protein
MIQPMRILPKNILHVLHAGMARRAVHHVLDLAFELFRARIKNFVADRQRPQLDRLRQQRRRGGDEILRFPPLAGLALKGFFEDGVEEPKYPSSLWRC